MTTPIKDKLADVDPNILIFDGNPRKDTRIDTDWVAGIKERGIIHRILVEPTNTGGYLVVDGQRRTLGAIAAGLETVPILIRATTEQADLASDQLISNLQRKELTEAELLGGYKTLSLLGVSAEDITRRTGEKRTRVDAALKVAASEKTQALAATAQIDIEHLAAMVEFEDDKKATATLRDLAERSPGQFSYKVAELRRARDLKASKKTLTEKLKTAGVPIVKASDYEYTYSNPPGRKLDQLQTPAGKPISMTAHKKCPGHAAAIYAGHYTSTAEIWYVCADWKANGHELIEKAPVGYQESDEQRAEREQRDAARAEQEQKASISQDLRRAWVKTLLQRPDLRKLVDVDQVIARAYVGEQAYDLSRRWGPSEYHKITAEFLGLDLEPTATSHDAATKIAELTVSKSFRPFTITLAAALAHFEHFSARILAVPYRRYLVAWGYTPTDWEREYDEEILAAHAAREAEEAERLAQEEAERVAFNSGELREDVDGADQSLTAEKEDA